MTEQVETHTFMCGSVVDAYADLSSVPLHVDADGGEPIPQGGPGMATIDEPNCPKVTECRDCGTKQFVDREKSVAVAAVDMALPSFF